jgi:hypothetical protein
MKKLKSPGDRLILIICRHRPAATKREIARAHLTGADLEQAKLETVGLVEYEQIHRKGSRKRSWTARLTQRGIWQAIRLTTGYDPALAAAALAAVDIKAVLARLEAERNSLAVELAGYRHDAEAYRAQQKRSKALERKSWEMIAKVQDILSRPRHKLSARHYARLEKFLESRGIKPPAVKSAPSAPPRIRHYVPPSLSKVRCPECGNDTSGHVVGCSRWGILDVPASTMSTQQSPSFADLTKTCIVCRSRTLTGDPVDPNHDCENWQPLKI